MPGSGSAALATQGIRTLPDRCLELEVPETRFPHDIDAISIKRQWHVVARAREVVGGARVGRHLAMWGSSFKPGTDDVRKPPAPAVAHTVIESAGKAFRITGQLLCIGVDHRVVSFSRHHENSLFCSGR